MTTTTEEEEEELDATIQMWFIVFVIDYTSPKLSTTKQNKTKTYKSH